MPSSEADTQPQQSPPPGDQNGVFSIFIPIILGLGAASPPPSEGGETPTLPGRLVFINPLTTLGMVIQGAGNPDQLNKEGPLPASKKSIEDMPAVKITGELGSESCAICLGEYEVGGEAKEMPCKHRYHSDCIVNWLGIHGSCPVCRHVMPVEEKGDGDMKGSGEGENRGRTVEGEIRISVFFENTRNTNSSSGNDSGGNSGRSNDGGETNEYLPQDMDID